MIAVLFPTKQEYEAANKARIEAAGGRSICAEIGKIGIIHSLYFLHSSFSFDGFLLAGFAGAYCGLKKSEIISPKKVIEFDYDDACLAGKRHEYTMKPIDGSKAVTLLTQDKIQRGDAPGIPHDDCVAFDMEAYAFVDFMYRLRVRNYAVIKVISDYCNNEAVSDFLKSACTMKEILTDSVLLALKSMSEKRI